MDRKQRNELILKLREQGRVQKDIASEVGCSRWTVQDVLKAAGLTQGKARSVAERLRGKLIATPSGCLEFQGYCDSNGYGQISINDKTHLAHRVAFEQAHGPIPKGLVICHRCDNPSCCNPEHLFLGTHADNVADKVSKGRQFTKQTPEKLQQAVELRSQGLTFEAIGAALGVNYKTTRSWLRELEVN